MFVGMHRRFATYSKAELVQRLSISHGAGSRNCWLIDVRTVAEFMEGAVDQAVNCPLPMLCQLPSHEWKELFPGVEKPHPSDEVIVYCKMGGRATRAKEILQSCGFSNVGIFPGGWLEWTSGSR